MADKIDEMSRVIGSVEKGQASIEATLSAINEKLDTVLPLVNNHDKKLEGHHERLKVVEDTIKPLVEAHNRRVWVGLGWFAGAGTLASSPLWVTKLLPFLAALPK